MRIRHGKTVNIDKVKFITLLVTIQVLWVCLYYQGWRLKNVYTKCWCRKWFSRNDVQDIIWWNVPTFPGKLFSFHSMKENSQWKKMLYLIMYFGHFDCSISFGQASLTAEHQVSHQPWAVRVCSLLRLVDKLWGWNTAMQLFQIILILYLVNCVTFGSSIWKCMKMHLRLLTSLNTHAYTNAYYRCAHIFMKHYIHENDT